MLAGYSFLDATFLDTITLASPDNPLAINGEITVLPGNRIPSIPRHRFKAAADYAVTDTWKVGANLIAFSGQYLRGDEFEPQSDAARLLDRQPATRPGRSTSRCRRSGW